MLNEDQWPNLAFVFLYRKCCDHFFSLWIFTFLHRATCSVRGKSHLWYLLVLMQFHFHIYFVFHLHISTATSLFPDPPLFWIFWIATWILQFSDDRFPPSVFLPCRTLYAWVLCGDCVVLSDSQAWDKVRWCFLYFVVQILTDVKRLLCTISELWQRKWENKTFVNFGIYLL